ncbi:Permease of the drug/metabolite transporter (DMT) superfamily [Humidesulfovibrio mexicanus]|uniref:Permease of the drug/metabolite transporter (DMT) superfamily n=1 Tax=Humidesulfovibrio mexicanus TaxID=147047 RepID=A0A239C3R4_9BACT|nr:DMT family transporter [Humidesulfovibrio mexicanus]SNS14271.1 Permease of the drug/metabolite transporter (DMT) superfamily [Humidesulfovibrio mexicanus]
MSAARPGLAVYAKLVGSMALWGATWVSGRYVAQVLSPFAAAFLRFLFASTFLYLLLCRATAQLGGQAGQAHGGTPPDASRTRWPRPPRALLPGLAFLGFTGVFLYNALFFSGLARIPAGRAAMIVACVPSAVALYSGLVLRSPTGLVKGLGIALSLAGVSVILSEGNPLSLFTHGADPGDLLILGCVAAWAAYTIAGGRVMRRATPLAAVTWSCVLGCAMLLPAALATGLAGQVLAADWIIWANMAFLGVGATGLAFTWYYDGILALGAARASVFINLVPVFATALGCALLGEGVGLPLVAGGLMVLGGVALANRTAASGQSGQGRNDGKRTDGVRSGADQGRP